MLTTITTPSPFKTLSEVKARNAANGYNWFSRDTMRHWKSRVESNLIAGRFFISSEDDFGDMFGGQKHRIYQVRYANDDGTIATVRSHMRDKDDARELIRAIVKGAHAKAGSGQRCITCGEYREECGGTL